MSGDDTAGGPEILTAMREQLGLGWIRRKAPVEVMVVDLVEKMPTEN